MEPCCSHHANMSTGQRATNRQFEIARLAETPMACMVAGSLSLAGALLSESLAVLALACYILLCLHVMVILPRDVSPPEPLDRASQREQPPRRTAEPQLGPGSRRRLVQAGSASVAAPARPGQITSAKGRKEPNLLIRIRSHGADSAGVCETTDPAEPIMPRPASKPSLRVIELSAKQTGRNKAKEPPVQRSTPTQPKSMRRSKSHESLTSAPFKGLRRSKSHESLTSAPFKGLRRSSSDCTDEGSQLSQSSTPVTRPESLTSAPFEGLRRSSSHESLQLSREIVIHGDALASRIAFKLQQVEKQLARAWRAERRRTADEKSLQHGVAVDASVPVQRALGCHSKPSMRRSWSEPSLGDIELSPTPSHRAPASPQGTGSKDSRCGSSLPGIKGSRGPFVSSSSKFYANVVSRQGGKPAVLII